MILANRNEIVGGWMHENGVDRVEIHRIDGEAVEAMFAGHQMFSDPSIKYYVGDGDAVSKHGPQLHNLVIRTEGTAEQFSTLMLQDGALRNALLNDIAVIGPMGEARADLEGPARS